MKIAVIYNRDSKNVINLFGIPNREKYGKEAIDQIVDALKEGGHQVQSFEGDKDLIPRLEEFMPRVLKGEIPGLAFNLSYGIQGKARYTHVPGILEMVGIPYVGSNPLAHSLALDKVVAKMIFRQHGLPTPDFAVLKDPDFEPPDLEYPLIVKPKNESISMGLKVVNNFNELKEAAGVIFDLFGQAVLVEQFIEGREINVGLLGNNPPESFPPCEIVFGQGGPNIYTFDDKKETSSRKIEWICPAPLDEKLQKKAQELAKEAFAALGCYDTARVDMRLDKNGDLFILEINSLPSLKEHGSYVIAAKHEGMDFDALINRIVEVASVRYFGTAAPSVALEKADEPEKLIFQFITSNRDQMERSLEEWTIVPSRTADPVGSKLAIEKLDAELCSLNLKVVPDLTDRRSVWTWETNRGMKSGTLLLGHIDVPLEPNHAAQLFRKEPEWLHGEGIGISRAPLVMALYALKALRHHRMLHKQPIGILYYMDEGRDCRYSAELIQKAAKSASRVMVLRPGGYMNQIYIQQKGQRKYFLTIKGKLRVPGEPYPNSDTLIWTVHRLHELTDELCRRKGVTVDFVGMETEGYPMRSPHKIHMTMMVGYLDNRKADESVERIREILTGSRFKIRMEMISDRPPMKKRPVNRELALSFEKIASDWDIPLQIDTSVWPSAGGLVPKRIPVIGGIGPIARDMYTPHEAVDRTSLIQRTLLLAQFLIRENHS